ncbi:MAG: hypothetical protein IKD04_05780 [Clostridia bacterium]|nr:hypothetical protein [Clostridia bacterium]
MALTELSQNEQIERYKQTLLKLFETKITDENIRIYILKDSDYKFAIKKNESDYISYIDNILSLAFIFAYGCYRYDCDYGSCCYDAKKQNSIRIINSFKKAYYEHPVTLELKRFVLSDIQLYMQQMKTRIAIDNDGEIYEVFANMSTFDDNFSLVKYFNMIARWKASPLRANLSIKETAEMLCELVKHMPFLENYSLVHEDGQTFFRHKFNYEDEKYSIININHLLYIDNVKYFEEIFSLFSLKKEEEGYTKSLQARYISGGDYNSLDFRVSSEAPEKEQLYIEYDAEDFFYEITGLAWDGDDDTVKKNDDYLINHIHAINYKYIKNLALSISDAMVLIHGSRQVLYDLFGRKYPDVFARVKNAQSIDDTAIDWDGIIVMLLIEASPSKVLETLIESNEQMFYYIVSNICKRIDNPQMPIYNIPGEILREKVEEIINKKLIIGEASGFGYIKRDEIRIRNKRLFARAAAMLIISSLSAIVDDRIICAGNIYDNEALLKSIMLDKPDEQKKEDACVVLGETFKHLLCFYKGTIAYGKEKAVIDAKNYDKALSTDEILTNQTKLNTEFLQAAKTEMEAIRSYDTKQPVNVAILINRFIELSNRCAQTKGIGGNSDSNGLYVAIGKYEIFDVQLFKKGFGTLIEDLETNTVEDGDDLIHSALKLLRFLTSGSYGKGAVSELNTIYPFTATYNRGNENYDGYKTVTFTLNLKRDSREENSGNEINVLTEFKYNLCDVFYCLPNTLRANKRWWIDPLLINFKEFNDIFVE